MKAAVFRELAALANPSVRAKMAHFEVDVEEAYGISAPRLHALARRIGKSHRLANQLWGSGNHEAKILATLIGEPAKVTQAEMNRGGLRNIGKRNVRLNRAAIRCGERIRKQGTSSARWIAADALRELRSEGVQRRLRRKKGTR